ncbi:hypothetical protein ADL22_01100 [Streptomyces sp. NRRL F-4489]|uniref:hypothetical protein n=1 Tax=Streptomyces sp. NRRL F-4489 TaxID=1609095 RepID=UPI00074B23B4|nr:hypothetical protein [Streptomyces sp. NRRL F-4489]KUL55511.1 hypothetical protein ADL22_01100 [Streptomyces sp. NRRL F-4489]
MELEHLHTACDLMRRHDGRDPADILLLKLPNVLTLEPNKQYLHEDAGRDPRQRGAAQRARRDVRARIPRW